MTEQSYLITDIHPSIYQFRLKRENLITKDTIVHSRYEIAVWLNMPGFSFESVKLIVDVKDSRDDRKILLDQGKTDDRGGIMLSNVIMLRSRGKIRTMALRALSRIPENHYGVEHLFIERVFPGRENQSRCLPATSVYEDSPSAFSRFFIK